MSLVNMDTAPSDPIERILWLSGVHAQVVKELDEEYAKTYFDARLQGRLDAAVLCGVHAKSSILRYTRNENESRGRAVRWGDGADPTSRKP